ncbi:hypothetical protein Gotri_008741, partial [Gossypium trilobum]|nr:hypothetical protein [Gossypium trilobum]
MTSNFNMEHWDCQAVTGETCSNNDAFISYMENPEFSFGPLSFQHGDEDHLMSFPEVFEPNPNVLDELMEELYKPFCPELNPYTIPVLEDHVEEPECQKQQPLVVTKPKRSSRKKQQHRVVKHVTADDGLQSDIWSWRKYGQKPIKGSPYPSDELVESFEGFGDLFVDQFPDLSHELWFMNESATLTG